MSKGIIDHALDLIGKKTKRFTDLASNILRIYNKLQRGYGKQPNIIAVHFPADTHYDNSPKRLRFIGKLGVKPIKRQHKTPNYYKYRIKESNPNKKHFSRKIDGVNVIFEI